MTEYHKPVLLKEAVDGLVTNPGGVYVDVTFGGSGHTLEILKRLGASGRVFGVDRDEEARQNIPADSRFTFIHGNFRYLQRYLRLYGVDSVAGVLADLGVSSHQFDEQKRGFAYRMNSKLDMRMNVHTPRTAKDVVMEYPEAELVRVLSDYGEVRNARTVARKIVKSRYTLNIENSATFMRILEPLVKGSRLRYFSQIFQALRIEVNDEMGALKALLEDCKRVIETRGRLVVITYHSLEDRIVKRFIKAGNPGGELLKDDFGVVQRPFKEINKKVIVPSEEEIKHNKRARSAKLRIAQRI